MRAQSRKARQQRWMHVDHATRVAIHKAVGQHAHEAREHDEVRLEAVDFARERRIEQLAAVETAMSHHRGSNAVRLREAQASGIGFIGNDRPDARRPALASACAHDGLHVAAASGDQNDDVFHP